MADILDDLRDLHKQATTERSHYYVAKCALRAIEEIESLRALFIGRCTEILTTAKQTNEIVRKANDRLDRAGIP